MLMRKAKPATLFEIAGVAPTATPEEIEARFEEALKAANGNLAAMGADVRNAFSVLKVAQNVELYRDLLRSCTEETNVPVRTAEVDTFTRFCAMCLITPFQHPQQRELFRLCIAGQAVPEWVRYDPRTMSHLRMRWGQRLEQLIQRYLLGGVFRGRSAGQRTGIVLAYLVFLSLAGVGVRAFVLALVPVPAAAAHTGNLTKRPALDERPSVKPAPDFGPLTATCERVAANLRHIDEQAAVVAREFQVLMGMKLDEAATDRTLRPKVIEAAIAKDPTVKEAWKALLDERIDPSDISERKSTLDAIQKRVSSKEPRDSDDADAQQMESWTKTMLERLRGQRNYIDHVRVMLDADRFQQALDKPDGSKP